MGRKKKPLEQAQHKYMAIYEERQAGASLQAIAVRRNVSRESIRQLLQKYFGGTSIDNFLTTKELANLLDLSLTYIDKLKKAEIIKPVNNNHRCLLWGIATIKQIRTIRVCQKCGKPLPSRKSKYCSDACYQSSVAESHKRTMWRLLYKKQGKPIPPSLAY